jgi:hypothetical protein
LQAQILAGDHSTGRLDQLIVRIGVVQLLICMVTAPWPEVTDMVILLPN